MNDKQIDKLESILLKIRDLTTEACKELQKIHYVPIAETPEKQQEKGEGES